MASAGAEANGVDHDSIGLTGDWSMGDSSAVRELSLEERIRSLKRTGAAGGRDDQQAALVLKLNRHGFFAATGLLVAASSFAVMTELAAPSNRVWWFLASVVALSVGLKGLVDLVLVAFGGTEEMRPDGRSVTWMDRTVRSMTIRLIRQPDVKRSSSTIGGVRIVQIASDDGQGRERTRQ